MNSISLPGAPRRGIRAGLGAQIAQTARLWRRVVDDRMRPFGLTEATWLPLLHLARAPAAIRQKDLAASLSLDSSSVVRLLDALEAAGPSNVARTAPTAGRRRSS
jgi:MarR family transcriptional regulator, transcriptional regulator for hemolysin